VREEQVPRFDWRGFALAGLGLAGVMMGFENRGRDLLPPAAVAGWSPRATAALLLYVLHARRRRTRSSISRCCGSGLPRRRAGGFVFRIGVGAIPFLRRSCSSSGSHEPAALGTSDLRRRGRRHHHENDGRSASPPLPASAPSSSSTP